MGERGSRPGGVSRRHLLLAGAAAGAGLALGGRVAGAAGGVAGRLDPAGGGWTGWRCPGVANLGVADGLAVLEAGSDVFPDDPRPVAFLVDARVRDATVRADVARAGSLVGVVLRRTSPTAHYAAVVDVERATLAIVRRSGTALDVLAEVAAPVGDRDLVLSLTATGAAPTALEAAVRGPGGVGAQVRASDGTAVLQRAGDPGVLTRARTLFPSAGPPVLPALGNLHLLPYGVQEGGAFVDSPAGRLVVDEIRRGSTAAFRGVEVRSAERPGPTPAAVLAATTGVPRPDGARVHVACDLPADVELEVAATAAFERPRRVRVGRTGAFDAVTAEVRGGAPGERVWWRPVLRRQGVEAVGPARSFRVAPALGASGRVRLAVGSCAAQFGPLFDRLARLAPDVLVWQGDLNYPDTHGPLAQTPSGYAGIWRDLLAAPPLAPVLSRAAFVAVRDDHDYGVQDARAATIPAVPWSLGPWDALLGDDVGLRFPAGPADVWVLDQRRHKSDPREPDGPGKTLLGERQLAWLLDGLRTSRAPFKVICSPCTVFMPFNARDGNWATGFTAERDALLEVVDREVDGEVLFLTGDTHLTGVFDRDGRFEARACPLGIPVPNDITISDPLAGQRLRRTPGVAYADERCHATVLDLSSDGRTAVLELSLVREDGATPYRRRFEAAVPAPAVEVGAGRTRGATARRRGVRVRVATDRPAAVRLRTVLRRGRRTVRFGPDRVLRLRGAGARRGLLRPGRRARAALRSGRWRVEVTARLRDLGGRQAVARVRRLLGR